MIANEMAGPMRKTKRANFHSIDDLAQSDRPVQELLPLTELNFNLTGCTCYPMLGMEPLYLQSCRMDSQILPHRYSIAGNLDMPGLKSTHSEKPSYSKDSFTSYHSYIENSQSQNKHQRGSLRKYRKQRVVFEPTQLEILEETFASNAYPSAAKFEFISRLTMIDEARLKIWFQNRRARCRKSAKNCSLFQVA